MLIYIGIQQTLHTVPQLPWWSKCRLWGCVCPTLKHCLLKASRPDDAVRRGSYMMSLNQCQCWLEKKKYRVVGEGHRSVITNMGKDSKIIQQIILNWYCSSLWDYLSHTIWPHCTSCLSLLSLKGRPLSANWDTKLIFWQETFSLFRLVNC